MSLRPSPDLRRLEVTPWSPPTEESVTETQLWSDRAASSTSPKIAWPTLQWAVGSCQSPPSAGGLRGVETGRVAIEICAEANLEAVQLSPMQYGSVALAVSACKKLCESAGTRTPCLCATGSAQPRLPFCKAAGRISLPPPCACGQSPIVSAKDAYCTWPNVINPCTGVPEAPAPGYLCVGAIVRRGPEPATATRPEPPRQCKRTAEEERGSGPRRRHVCLPIPICCRRRAKAELCMAVRSWAGPIAASIDADQGGREGRKSLASAPASASASVPASASASVAQPRLRSDRRG